MIPAKCSSNRRDRNIVLEEKNKSVRIENNICLDLKIVKVDGCAISNSTACDFAVFCEDRGALIELKGCHIDRAVQQLVITHDFFRGEQPKHSIERGYIVSSRVPSVPTSLRKIEEAYRRTKMKIVMKNRVLQINSTQVFG